MWNRRDSQRVNACRALLLGLAFSLPIAHSADVPAVKSITIDGSSAMSPFVRSVSTDFARDNKVGVSLRERGSKTGYQCVLSKECELGLVAMDLNAETEKSKGLIVSKIAYDGLSLLANRDCGMEGLTREQVSGIFNGKFKNWNEVGGADLPITAWQRRETSGIFPIFKKFFDIQQTIQNVLGTEQEMLNRMKAGKGFITYAGAATALTLKEPQIRPLKLDGTEVSAENLRNGAYKLRYTVFLVMHKDWADSPVVKSLFEKLLTESKSRMSDFGMVAP